MKWIRLFHEGWEKNCKTLWIFNQVLLSLRHPMNFYLVVFSKHESRVVQLSHCSSFDLMSPPNLVKANRVKLIMRELFLLVSCSQVSCIQAASTKHFQSERLRLADYIYSTILNFHQRMSIDRCGLPPPPRPYLAPSKRGNDFSQFFFNLFICCQKEKQRNWVNKKPMKSRWKGK